MLEKNTTCRLNWETYYSLQLYCHLMHIYVYIFVRCQKHCFAVIWDLYRKYPCGVIGGVLMSEKWCFRATKWLKDPRKKCNAKIFWKNLGPRYFQRPITSIRTSISSVMTPTENSVKSVRDAYCWYVHLWHHCSSSFWNNSVNQNSWQDQPSTSWWWNEVILHCVFSQSMTILTGSRDDLWMICGWPMDDH